jgi:hypothetical protein
LFRNLYRDFLTEAADLVPSKANSITKARDAVAMAHREGKRHRAAHGGTGNNGLSAVRVLGSGEVWAVGASPQGALVTRLEAGSWKLCGQPTRLGDSNENLYAIADPADDELYAIGGGSDNNGTISYHSFMLHYAGGDWTKLG